MRRGSDWYKRDPILFMDGVEGLGPELIGVYAYVLDLIYARDGHSLRDDKALAGRIGCSKRKITTLLDQLIERGKIEFRDGYLTHKHAESHANTRRLRSEHAVEAGRVGGEKSGEVRKNKALAEASASIETKQSRVEKRREDADDERAREFSKHPPPAEATFRERILSAIGVDPISGFTGHGGFMLGRMSDMAEANAWLSDLGLTEEEVIGVVSEVMAKRDGPPNSFKYYTPAMREFAGAKSAPKQTSIEGGAGDPSRSSGRKRGPGESRGASAHETLMSGFARAVSDEP